MTGSMQFSFDSHMTGVFIKYIQGQAGNLEDPYLTKFRRKTFALLERLLLRAA